jgi:hypothetical protein
VFEVSDVLVGGGKLVFEADDAGGCSQGHVLSSSSRTRAARVSSARL